MVTNILRESSERSYEPSLSLIGPIVSLGLELPLETTQGWGS